LSTGNAETLGLQDVKLHAEGAAIDLRGAQLDELEHLLVEACLGGKLAECPHGITGIRRQRLNVGIFAAGM
jgi:hypothetical protein